VAENEHLSLKMWGSERLALGKQRMDGEIEEGLPLPVEKAKVFGKQMRREGLVDGGIEDEMLVG
jgi:hypothetical protein